MVDLQPTILIVDDDEDLRDTVAEYLGDQGYQVETAGNGREALRKLRAGLEPCLIMTDIMMPQMDGIAFRRAQLQDPNLAVIPVIAYSGIADLEVVARDIQVSAYLRKPTDLQHIAVTIGRHRLRRQLS